MFSACPFLCACVTYVLAFMRRNRVEGFSDRLAVQFCLLIFIMISCDQLIFVGLIHAIEFSHTTASA